MKHLKSGLMAALLLSVSLPALAQSVAVIVNPKNAAPPSAEQISNIFLGKSNDMTGVDLPDGNATRDSCTGELRGLGSRGAGSRISRVAHRMYLLSYGARCIQVN